MRLTILKKKSYYALGLALAILGIIVMAVIYILGLYLYSRASKKRKNK